MSHNTSNPQPPMGKAYYYTGAFFVALALVLFMAVATMETLYGVLGNTYTIVFGIFAVFAFTGSFALTHRAIRAGKKQQTAYYITGILRFVTSTVMLGYAFTKLNNGHMYASYAALDTRLNDLSDFDTVWSFYGRYSSLQALLGAMELIPAIMLLFRRTTFIGTVLMLPVAANVLLLNAYFSIGFFTLPVIALVVVFCLYILYSYKEQVGRLLQWVSTAGPSVAGGRWLRFLKRLRFLPIGFFLLVMVLKTVRRHQSSPRPTGAYELTDIYIDGRKVAHDSLPVDAYRKIYFEKRAIQSSVVNGEGSQGAGIHFSGRDSVKIAYRHGALDMVVQEETVGAFTGRYMQPTHDELVLAGQLNGKNTEVHYKRIPLREFNYWWE